MKLADLKSNARLWLYQSNRELTETEMVWLNEKLALFATDWAAHGNQLKAAAEVLNPYFIAFAVDLEVANASGCSIDSSVRFVKTLGTELNVDFFNRLKVVVESVNGEVTYVSYAKLPTMTDAIIFNPLVDELGDLADKFKINVGEFLALAH